MPQILRDESMAPMLARGTVVWRPVHFEPPELRTTLPQVVLNTTEKENQHVARVSLDPHYLWEPTVAPSTVVNGRTAGIVVFIDGPIPDWWTHLVIIGQSTAMRSTPRKRGGCLFAEAPQPAMDMCSYMTYRRQMAMEIRDAEEDSFDARRKTAKRFCGNTGKNRVVMFRNATGPAEYDYEIFED